MTYMLPQLESIRMYACASKLAYDTRHAAMRVARIQLRRKGAHLRAYRCQFCNCWHLMSDFRKKRKSARKSNNKGS